MGVQNAWVFSTNHKTTRDWVVSLVENTHAFCTRTIIGRKQGYKMREYFLLENIERKFGWKSVSIFYHFDRTISSGIKKVAEKAQKNCFPLLRSGTKKYIICPNDDLLLWTSHFVLEDIQVLVNPINIFKTTSSCLQSHPRVKEEYVNVVRTSEALCRAIS